MRDYEELVKAMRYCSKEEVCDLCPRYYNGGDGTSKCFQTVLSQAADAIEELIVERRGTEEAVKVMQMEIDRLLASRTLKEEVEREWISVEEPPENDRNIFICHGSVAFKAPCIGHYDPGMKMFYEDTNWFASPIYDAMFWCEMPKLPLPEPPKEET